MRSAEVRVLRFLHAADIHESWISRQTILNTDDLLPGIRRRYPH
jgi:hypothetical protein